jgi:hypothetical protein
VFHFWDHEIQDDADAYVGKVMEAVLSKTPSPMALPWRDPEVSKGGTRPRYGRSAVAKTRSRGHFLTILNKILPLAISPLSQ